jgi:CBS domain-containing protein
MHAPISAVLMIFEITRHPMVILPLMLATVIASLVSALIQPDDIHHWGLKARGIRLDRHRHADPLRGRRVHELLRREAPEVPHDMPLGQVIARLLERGSHWGFVVDNQGRLTGTIHGADLSFALTERDALDGLVVAADLAQPVREAARPDDDLAVALKLLDRAREEVLPVVDEAGVRLGEISRADVFAVFHEERLGEIDLGDGVVLVELEVPPHAYGKTLPELDIRRRFHIQVVMLRRRLADGAGRSAWKRWAPTPTDTLEPGDFLLVLGDRENIQNATKI